ncbi:hypothetical protein J1605_012350 [Eschrichtius robustus]|uniref:Uncharacterized protein n=1 Tax=Eschrichtius robustus TaxID=9764 RepID=A0AB34GKZ1_ESCRO|nr:hypothetical protein J1605_012350 [Eschrichtius robustus]
MGTEASGSSFLGPPSSPRQGETDSGAQEHQEGKTQALQERREDRRLRSGLNPWGTSLPRPHLPAAWPVALGSALSLLPRLLVLSGSVHSTLFGIFVEQPETLLWAVALAGQVDTVSALVPDATTPPQKSHSLLSQVPHPSFCLGLSGKQIHQPLQNGCSEKEAAFSPRCQAASPVCSIRFRPHPPPPHPIETSRSSVGKRYLHLHHEKHFQSPHPPKNRFLH